MLQAIMNGKAGRFQGSQSYEGISWRKVYKDHEDLLTAAIFSRLTYLPSDSFWALMQGWCLPANSFTETYGELIEAEFWPNYKAPAHFGKNVEPDAVLFFQRGILIVEAKRDDSESQTCEQWAREWASVLNEKRDVVSDVCDPGENIRLVAVGGLGPNETKPLETKIAETRELLSQAPGEDWPEFNAVSCAWGRLVLLVSDLIYKDATLFSSLHTKRLLEDIFSALELHGFRRTLWATDVEWNGLKENHLPPEWAKLLSKQNPPKRFPPRTEPFSQKVLHLLPVTHDGRSLWRKP